MSANDWTYNIREVTGTGDQPNPTRTTGNQAGFTDSSGPLFHMYREMAEEQDNKMTERWQKDAEGIIIFTGLFSAAVAALVAVTIGDLKPNSQDTSAFYIEKIYQLQVLADSNISLPSILAAPAQPPPFSPPTYAILVNSLWFLSLVISLTCAMMATLLQQWTRRYLRITQPTQCSPHRRARTRAFFAHGVDKFHLSWMVEALPALIHLSLFLFFIGLLIYLFNVNYTVFRAVVWWVAVSAATYLLTTVLPIFRLESPYYTPLTSFLTVLSRLERIAEKNARKSSAEIDIRVLKLIFSSLAEDKGLYQFFQCIIGFCNSNVVKDTHRILDGLGKSTLSSALVLFLNRTWMSNLVFESDKRQRFITCMKVVHVAQLSDAAWNILAFVFTKNQNRLLLSAEMGHSLRRLVDSSDQEIDLCAQILVAYIIATDLQCNESWSELAADQLRDTLPSNVPCYYDSVLLANLIYITRQIRATRQIHTIRQIRLPTTPHIQSRLPWQKRTFILPYYPQRASPYFSYSAPYYNPTSTAYPYSSSMADPYSSWMAYPNPTPMAYPYLSSMTYPNATPMAYPYTPQGYPLDTSQAQPLDTSQAQPLDTSQAQPLDTSQAQPLDTPQAQPRDTSQARNTSQAHPHDTPQASLFDLDVHDAVSRIILPSLSKFNILNTLAVLRYDFCALWNEIVLEAQGSAPAPVHIHILIGIRSIYIDLHRNTLAAPRVFSASTADSDNILRRASSYPLCKLLGHHPHVQEVPVVDDTTGVTAYSPATISTHTIDDSSTIFIPPLPSLLSIPPTLPPSDFSTPSLSGDIPDSPNLHSPSPIIIQIHPPISPTSPMRTPILEDRMLPPAVSTHTIDDSSSIFIPPLLSIPPTLPPSDFSTPSLSGDIPDSPYLHPPPPVIIQVHPPISPTSPIRAPILEDWMLPPAVTPVAISSPSLGAPAVQAIKFNGYGEFAPLMCHSPHTIYYQDELYPTALHLFEARKLIDQRPDLADRIRECESVEDVTSISAEMSNFARQDWGNVALSTMDEVLYLKFRQHEALRTLLFNTYPMELVYSESGDSFWGDGGGTGRNELGNSLMRVRDRLRAEGGM